MITELITAERKYYDEVNKRSRDINRALNLNQTYYEELFKLYRNSNDSEEKFELACELEYLIEQANALRTFQLKFSGGSENV